MLYSLCPICKSPLHKTQNSAVCPNGHTFDFAKEGYLYLLKPNVKNSRDPGDNKEMVCARREFLNGNFYKPLADEIAKTINEIYNESITLVDAGVGTGYYLHTIISSRSFADDVFLGADISKHAVKSAAKSNPSAQCCVASVFDLPYPNKFADVILCVFSPYAMTEYSRVLKDDGILIVVCPNENHLIELRQALYENVRDVNSPISTEGFFVKAHKDVCFDFTINDRTQISNLLAMTPYAYRAPMQAIEKLKEKENMTFTADFHIYMLKKSSR